VLRKKLAEVKTTLELPKEVVDLLIKAAGDLLEADPDYQRLLKDLRADS